MNENNTFDWEFPLLKELIDFAIGGDWGKDPTYEDDNYILVYCIRGSEFRNWESDKGNTASPRKIKKSSLIVRQLCFGDILLEISGGGPEQPVGRTVLIENSVLNYDAGIPKICTNFLRLLRPNKLLNSSYLNCYLQYFYKSGEVVRYQAGSNNLRNLKFDDYMSIKVPLPPLNEQKRIVAKIEELFSELDKGIESLKTAREQLKVYRQAVLKYAFEGKLTAKWRQLHKVPFERWKKSLVHDIATVGTGATPKRGNKRYYEGGKHAWVTSGALNDEYVTQVSEYITDAALEETNCKLYPPNTILVAMYGEGKTRGKASILKITAATNQACAAITITDDFVLLDYLWNFFRYNYENIRQKSSGGVQPNLNLSHIKNIAFPLPSTNEQIAINEQIETQFSCIYKMQEEIDENLQKADALRQSILKKAFSGKLVAQDPNDEPASVLLERIRAEKEAQSGKRKPKQKQEADSVIELAAAIQAGVVQTSLF